MLILKLRKPKLTRFSLCSKSHKFSRLLNLYSSHYPTLIVRGFFAVIVVVCLFLFVYLFLRKKTHQLDIKGKKYTENKMEVV